MTTYDSAPFSRLTEMASPARVRLQPETIAGRQCEEKCFVNSNPPQPPVCGASDVRIGMLPESLVAARPPRVTRDLPISPILRSFKFSRQRQPYQANDRLGKMPDRKSAGAE